MHLEEQVALMRVPVHPISHDGELMRERPRHRSTHIAVNTLAIVSVAVGRQLSQSTHIRASLHISVHCARCRCPPDGRLLCLASTAAWAGAGLKTIENGPISYRCIFVFLVYSWYILA